MSNEPLMFYCVCGQQGSPPDPDDHRWAQIVGYAAQWAVRWHTSADDAEVEDPPITLLNVPPRPGHEYWLRLRMPFAQQIGETFWCLYEDPLICANGIINEPDEVASLHLVACKLLGWERHDGKRAVGNVAVREVVALGQLRSRPAFAVVEPEVASSFEYGQVTIKRADGYIVVDQTVEGDDGSWAVLTDTAEPELLLFSTWGGHSDYVWAGRGLLSPQLSARLASIIADAG